MAWTLSDFMKTRIHELRQPSPLLQLYEVAIPDGSYQRFVDFADPQSGGSLPSKVPFNGAEYTATPIKRGEIQENSGGVSFQMPVTLCDPLHTIAYFLRTHQGLVGQPVKFWLIPFDDLATPADSFAETFEINSSSIAQGPDAVTVVLGHPNLYEVRVPKNFYDRRKCLNAYQDRFTIGNWCRYPGNEFREQRQEDLLRRATYAIMDRGHGWLTSHAMRASVFDVNITNTSELTITSSESRIAWKGRERYGPAFMREIVGDFDVETLLVLPATTRTKWLAGLLVQNQVAAAPVVSGSEEIPLEPSASWTIWGAQDNLAGSRRLCLRVTSAHVTAADMTTVATDLYLRLVRSGNTLQGYSKAAVGDAWTLRQSATIALPSATYLGLVLAADGRTATAVTARFGHILFNSGGISTCKRTWEDCGAHGNTIQFNGFREMPSDRARY